MFQNTGTGATMMPSMFLRTAEGWYHWPRKTWVGYCVQRSCTASAIAFCFAGSVSRANWSRSRSSSGSHGQPNGALSQLAFRNAVDTGFRMSAETHDVIIAFQPPCDGGSFFARRATTDCQSIDCMSTLKPPFSSSDLATGARLVSTCRSVECSSTIGVSSYPASFSSALDLAKLDSSNPSMPLVDASGAPQTNIALHTL
jgi:hypothetical protein